MVWENSGVTYGVRFLGSPAKAAPHFVYLFRGIILTTSKRAIGCDVLRSSSSSHQPPTQSEVCDHRITISHPFSRRERASSAA